MKRLGTQPRILRRVQIVAIVIWCIASFAAPFWWGARVKKTRELKALYYSALGGNVDAVRQLGESNSSEAISLLETLANAPHVFAESRVAAINALGARRFFDSEILAPLLWIEQPFTVRHAATGVFQQRGCDGVCVSAALYALHALWAGQLTAEDRWSDEHPEFSSQFKVSAEPLRAESEDDYLGLLSKNPCVVRSRLQSEYGSESVFVERIKRRIGRC